MILEVIQTKSAGQNLFEIIRDGYVILKGRTPWMKVNLPFAAGNLQTITLTDPQGRPVYEAKYSDIDICNDKLRICLGDRVLIGDHWADGDREIVSFYDGGQKIGQMTKGTAVIDNLDRYYLHIRNDYDDFMPAFVFSVLCYDLRFHGHQGEFSKGVSYNVTYIRDNTDKTYQDSFIRDYFGQQEADRLEQALNREKAEVKRYTKNFLKKIGIAFGIGWAAVLIIAGILILILWQKGLL